MRILSLLPHIFNNFIKLNCRQLLTFLKQFLIANITIDNNNLRIYKWYYLWPIFYLSYIYITIPTLTILHQLTFISICVKPINSGNMLPPPRVTAINYNSERSLVI